MNTLVPKIFYEAKAELDEIMAAGARGLKGPGLSLMPIKREMLNLPDDVAELVLAACNLLFAAILNYENAHWQIKTATDPISLVAARIDAGRAEGVVCSLFHGPTANLITTAMHHAPIAFYAMTEASPHLHIIERLNKLATT